jgi:hypothetical protein
MIWGTLICMSRKSMLMVTVPSQGPPIGARVLDPAAKIDPLKAGYRAG